MLNARGLVVLALLAVAAFAGWSVGGANERAKWENWNYAHVAWETKGDRK
jgi:hypothetical protein